MFKQTTAAALTLFLLAGCGAANAPMSAQSQAGAISAQAKKSAERPTQAFDRLIGMLSVHEESGQVMFEFGTKGLVFSDAVRKNPIFTVNGKDLAGGWGVRAGEDGKLYIETGTPDEFYLLGTYEIPKDRKNIEFRQKCAIKFEMEHTFKVKRPFNPMAHITFEIDLKSAPKLVKTPPKSLSIR
ncbi:MAG: hypothetical protein ACK46X_14945 [Candidatus Sericytochromatia bacterium]